MSTIELGAVVGRSTNPFRGRFDGNNQTIGNISIIGISDNVGLFGYTDGAVIKDLSISGSTIQGVVSFQGSSLDSRKILLYQIVVPV